MMMASTVYAARTGQPATDEHLYKLLRKEISAALSDRPSYEHIAEFVVLPEPLSAEDGTLTRTMKPRRTQIFEKYATELEQLLRKLR